MWVPFCVLASLSRSLLAARIADDAAFQDRPEEGDGDESDWDFDIIDAFDDQQETLRIEAQAVWCRGGAFYGVGDYKEVWKKDAQHWHKEFVAVLLKDGQRVTQSEGAELCQQAPAESNKDTMRKALEQYTKSMVSKKRVDEGDVKDLFVLRFGISTHDITGMQDFERKPFFVGQKFMTKRAVKYWVKMKEKEFLAERLPMRKPDFVRSSNLCGTCLFQQVVSQCQPIPSPPPSISRLVNLAPRVNRAFGFEFEVVLHQPTAAELDSLMGELNRLTAGSKRLQETVHAAVALAAAQKHYSSVDTAGRDKETVHAAVALAAAQKHYSSVDTAGRDKETRALVQQLTEQKGHGSSTAWDSMFKAAPVLKPSLAKQSCFLSIIRGPSQGRNTTLAGQSPCDSHDACGLDEYCFSCAQCVGAVPTSGAAGSANNIVTECGLVCKAEKDAKAAHPEKTYSTWCRPRRLCKPAYAIGGSCPVPLTDWQWAFDGSVKPLRKLVMDKVAERYRNAGVPLPAGVNQIEGVSLEITSPAPPHPLWGARGWRSTEELLYSFDWMDMQAGPSSGFHVHINVGNKYTGPKDDDKYVGRADAEAARSHNIPLTAEQIAHVWTAYALFQHPINEMLSPGRQNSKYCKPLLMNDAGIRGIFERMHRWVNEVEHGHAPADGTPKLMGFREPFEHNAGHKTVKNYKELDTTLKGFCNYALKEYDLDVPVVLTEAPPCDASRLSQKFVQLNLVPLGRYGTIEFRAHSSTRIRERVGRWIQFIIGFVHVFSRDHSMTAPFFDEEAWTDAFQLEQAQFKAKGEIMFDMLADYLDPDTKAFYLERRWEKDDPICKGEMAMSEEAPEQDEPEHFKSEHRGPETPLPHLGK